MIRVFPVKGLPNPPDETGGRHGQNRCSKRVWWRDWHNVTRRDVNGNQVPHHAQDIFAPSGSTVVAPESGTIIGSSASTGPTPRGGHWLRLMTDNRIYYMSHLLDAPAVVEGQAVQAGQIIARVGRTGNAQYTCPHLHIGARKRIGRTLRGGMAINLAPELRAAESRSGVVAEAPEEMAPAFGEPTIDDEPPPPPEPISVPGRLPPMPGRVPPIPADAVTGPVLGGEGNTPGPTPGPRGDKSKGARPGLSQLARWALGLFSPAVKAKVGDDDKSR